ncbi:hypothetical protein F6V25_11930 [Oryzomonas japonica]|uniref:Motility protein n=2 Tax=Oryzomonas TaxID=2855184 RepID=A0A5A9XT08_9BACT|nr:MULTISPECIES: hypothetical protein [Oryzomonas]KAA0895398.1 hypothetical protein ET418_02435 [Oryzomonas rubra]KAB0664765.1 hypothetical protein F6V25_11930 [Oryzomonas japonica]
MDISTIAGAALSVKAGQTQQTLSMAMVKQAANQQSQMADLLAQNVQQAPQADGSYNFSTYA